MNTKKIISCVVAPLVITGLLAYSVNEYCVRKTEEWYPTSGVWRLYNNDVKDKGIALLNLSVKNGHMMMFGTSELNNSPDIKVTTVPTSFYPNQYLNREVDIVGKPGAETLINIIRLGSIKNIDRVPVVFISSFTWFTVKEYSKKGVQNNFSELQYLMFLNNDKISSELKNAVSKEVYCYLKGSNEFREATFISWLHSDEYKTKKMLKLIFAPYFKVRLNFMILRDNIKAYRLVNKYHSHYQKKIVMLDWEKNRIQAINSSKEESVDSKETFYTYEYFAKKLTKEKLAKIKNKMKNNKMNISKEYKFHELFCSMANQIGVKPLVILESVNGYYFDYVGLAKSNRQLYVDKIAPIHQKYSLPYLDIQYMEYAPYFFRDSVHFSSLGWFEVNEKITKYFAK